MRIARRFALVLIAIVGPLVILAGGFVWWVADGVTHGVARTDGRVGGLGVHGDVRIVRDARGVPHIRAGSFADACFGEGYATAADRLFQMDLTRRFVLGKLGQVVGGTALPTDERARVVDVQGIVNDAYRALDPTDRGCYDAYADGVNAAAKNEPQAPEYRAIGWVFLPWTPEDSLAVGFATIIDLSGSWYDVIDDDAVMRALGPVAENAFFPTTDPRWDVPTVGGAPQRPAPLPALAYAAPRAARPVALDALGARDGLGSNAWVVGAARSRDGHPLLANDPHLERSIPGIWYLVDVEAPGFHAAGATFAGVPGVILGHNDTLAWGATRADVVSPRVYTETFTSKDGTAYRAGNAVLNGVTRVETFANRLGNPEHRTYVRTRHGFVLETSGLVRHAVQWDADVDRHSAASVFLALDRARSLGDALRALASYPGPSQNFVLAATDGRAGYALAGHIPDDPTWGLRTVDGASTRPAPLRFVPFAQLPHVAPSRDVVAVSANNQPYGAGYPYRLSPAFTPPYRAAEIRARLAQATSYDVDDFREIQADQVSVADRELAGLVVAAIRAKGADSDASVATVSRDLAAFDGRFEPASVGATVIQRVRSTAIRDLVSAHMPADAASAYLAANSGFAVLMRALRERPHGWFPNDDRDAFLVNEVRAAITAWNGIDALAIPYGQAYPVQARHPLSTFGYHGWDGPRVPGQGGAFAPAVQGFVLGQSFRAVWDVGNWDAGGIDIPLGESGEPGSPHYTDLAPRYAAHELTPLPYSDAAVARTARGTLVLAP